MTELDEIESFLRAFSDPVKTDRYCALLRGSNKHRLKLYQMLGDLEISESLMHRIGLRDGQIDLGDVKSALAHEKAPADCVVWSEEFDPAEAIRRMKLTDAISLLGGTGATIVSCIAGKLGVYRADYLNDVFIMKR